MSKWWQAMLAAVGLSLTTWVGAAQEPGGGEGRDEGKKSAPRKEPAADSSFPGADGVGLRIVPGRRSATADGRRGALGYTSAPLIDVAQPRPDTLLVTMTAMAAAGGLPCEESAAEATFDLAQAFTVVNDRPTGRPIRLVLEAQLAGLFRGNRDGAGVAAVSVPAEAVVCTPAGAVAHVGFPGRSHAGKGVVTISDRSPAVEAPVAPGEYSLTQRFAIRCSHPKRCFNKNVVIAMFGEAGRAPEWLALLDPARDLPRGRDLGFRVAVRVEPAPAPPAAPLDAPRPLPPAR